MYAAGGLRDAASTLVRQNVMATRRLVGIACRQNLRRFVLVTSLAVYDTAGLRAGALLDERCALDGRPEARSAYAYSEIVQEQVCWWAHRSERLPLVVVRPGGIFGPGPGCATERAGPRIGRWVALVGPLRPLPYTFVRYGPLCDRVKFAGIVEPPTLARWYCAADALVMLSRLEGMPNVLYEAKACGTPVVATGVGDVAQALDEGDRLVAPDDPANLAVAIVSVLSTPPGRRAARSLPTWEDSAAALTQLIGNVRAGSSAPFHSDPPLEPAGNARTARLP